MKSIITADEHAALSPEFQKEYSQREGGTDFVLTLEGDPPTGFSTQAKVDEFRQNNIDLLKQVDGFKATETAQKEEIANLKKQIEDGGQKAAEGQTEMEKLTARMTALENSNAQKDEALAQRDKALAERDFEANFTDVFGKVHVKEHLRTDALTRARQAGWGLTEDKKGLTNGERDADDPTKPLAPETWATKSLPKEFFKTPSGGDDRPGGPNGQPLDADAVKKLQDSGMTVQHN